MKRADWWVEITDAHIALHPSVTNKLKPQKQKKLPPTRKRMNHDY